jgi:hypothetical protein
MAQLARGRNPYAVPAENVAPGSAPNPAHDFLWAGPGRYAVPNVPESTLPGYDTGYSTELSSGGSPVGTPDDIRIGTRNPPPNDPNQHAYNAKQKSEFHKRHAEERNIAGYQRIRQERLPAPRVPLWEQERPATRPLASQSPVSRFFMRPWHRPRNRAEVDGGVLHFSMANHRRNYEINTMRPQGGVGMNTHRVTPRPWDEDLYVPPAAPNLTDNAFGGGPRAYRLG